MFYHGWDCTGWDCTGVCTGGIARVCARVCAWVRVSLNGGACIPQWWCFSTFFGEFVPFCAHLVNLCHFVHIWWYSGAPSVGTVVHPLVVQWCTLFGVFANLVIKSLVFWCFCQFGDKIAVLCGFGGYLVPGPNKPPVVQWVHSSTRGSTTRGYSGYTSRCLVPGPNKWIKPPNWWFLPNWWVFHPIWWFSTLFGGLAKWPKCVKMAQNGAYLAPNVSKWLKIGIYGTNLHPGGQWDSKK